jgi:hypothetical protein
MARSLQRVREKRLDLVLQEQSTLAKVAAPQDSSAADSPLSLLSKAQSTLASLPADRVISSLSFALTAARCELEARRDVAARASLDALRELDALRRSVVELETSRAERDEQRAQELALRAEHDARQSAERGLLQSQVDALDEQMQGARASEIECRRRAIQAEAKAERLQASVQVLEARLDAAARRELALDATVRRLQEQVQPQAPLDLVAPLPPMSPPLPPPPPPFEPPPNAAFALEAGLAHAQQQLTKLDAAKSRADWARVEAERHAAHLEERLAHSSAQVSTLQHRVAALAEAMDVKDRQVQGATPAQPATPAKPPALPSPPTTQAAPQVAASKLHHAERRILRLMRESGPDLTAVLCIVHAKLTGSDLDIDDVLGAAPLPPAADPEAQASAVQQICDRARHVRAALVDGLADEAGARCGVQ